MARELFGTDGIRGPVGTYPITPYFMLRLGHAVGRVLKETDSRPAVLIGKDTRVSGYMIESALEAGFASAGVDVLLSGPLPTPAVAYLTKALRLSLGAVISASHNPFADNGIKFFSSRGEKLADDWESHVEAVLAQSPEWMDSASLGKARRVDDARGRYIEFCKSTFASDLTLKGLKIVVDAAHGAAYQVAPSVFHELGAEVITIGCAPDGFNINAGVGATSPAALVQAVAAHRADFGVALDGDADRVQMVDAAGRLYGGDELLYVLAQDRLAQGRHIPGVVGTQMTNLGVELALRNLGLSFARAKVGDRYVLEELLARGWALGGEGSGHLLALDQHTTGDGIISALQVLQAVIRGRCALSDLLGNVRLSAQKLINVRVAAELEWQSHSALQAAMAQVTDDLGSTGRVLVRASGTEPVVRVMVEAQSDSQAAECAERIAATLRA